MPDMPEQGEPKGTTPPQQKKRTDGSLPAEFRLLAQGLHKVLRYRAKEESLCVRSDGFAKLEEALSVGGLQQAVEQAAPGSAAPLNTSGWGGPMSPELLSAVREVVSSMPAVFEFWDPNSDELWIRTTADVAEEDWQTPTAVAPPVQARVREASLPAWVKQQSEQKQRAAVGWTQEKVPRMVPSAKCNSGTEVAAPAEPAAGLSVGHSPGKADKGPRIVPPLQAATSAMDTNVAGRLRLDSCLTKPHAPFVSPQPEAVPASNNINLIAKGKEELQCKGRFRSYCPEQGYGFLCSEAVAGTDVYFHKNSIIGDLPEACAGQPSSEPLGPEAEFDLVWKGGRPRAVNLRLVHGAKPTPEASSPDQVANAASTAPSPAQVGPAAKVVTDVPAAECGKHAVEQGSVKELSPLLDRFSRGLLAVLRHSATREGLNVRTDGFAKLDEALSVRCLQRLVEGVAPGSAGDLNTCGYGGPVPPELLQAVRELVANSYNDGLPRYELWEDDTSAEVWIRATHKHTLPHVEISANLSAAAGEEVPWNPHAEAEAKQATQPQSAVVSPWVRATRETITFTEGTLGSEASNGWDQMPEAAASTPKAVPPINASNWKDLLGDDRRCGPPRAGTTSADEDAQHMMIASAARDALPPPPPNETPVAAHKHFGRIKAWYPEKGFGFVASDAAPSDIFVHASNFILGPPLQKYSGRSSEEPTGPKVEFDLEWKRGRPAAVNAKLLTMAEGETLVESHHSPLQKQGGGWENSLNGSAFEQGQGTSPQLEDLVRLLPSDAPRGVRAYLATLLSQEPAAAGWA